RIEAAVPGGAANIQDIYPLVPMQEGMLFHHLLHAGGDAYVMHIGLSFDSREGLEGFLAAFNQVIARHDILRTAVLWENLPQPVQVVWRHAPLRLQWLDPEREASGPLSDVAARLRGFVEPARLRIDVRRAPMLAAIAAHDPTQGRWLLQIPHHHLGVDHATIERIVEEIALLRQGRAEDLPAPVPFRRFVAQARLGVSEAEHEDFFRRMLGDVDEPTAPFGLMDVLADGSHVREAQLALEPALARQLRNEAQRHGVSAATLFHLAYALVISQSTGRNDVVFGTVLLGRMQGGAHAGQALGMFVNTLPLRARLGGRTVTQALREMQQGLTELLHHEQASLSLALRASAMPERLPLFTALLNYRHSAVGEAAAAPAWPGMEVLDRQERTNYPFDLSVDDTGEGFVLVAQVEERIDPERVIALMLAATQAIVQALALEPERRISALDLVPARERAMLAAWGRGDGAGAGAPPAHRLFERQAQACPDAPALVSEGRTLSYAALDRQANRLAHHLIALGVRPEDRVGVALPRCADLFIGLLAVLKAGAAYVPLDPDYPAERLAHMVADSGMARVLTLSALQGRLPPSAGLTMVALDRLAFGPDAPVHDPALTVHPQQLAYVVYTSGSTGRAKGVAVPHGPLGMHLQAITRRYGLVRGDRLLQFTSISFDAAAEQWLGPWSTGATVVVAGAGRQSPQELLRLACAEQVNVLYFAPALMRHVSEAALQGAAAPDVRLCIVGGEAWSRPDFLQANAAFGPERLHNAYGPTECVVTPCAWSGNGAVPDGGPTMPVGRAVGDRHAVVLGADLDPLPRGAVGELYLGGQGLARGYLGRAAWSAERFVAAEGGGRLYRTGDLVRWNERGELEYMGRADQQLKLHGFRIEPGEIESQLRAQPQVREAAVVAAQDRLVAYVALHAGQVLDAAALRRHLEQTLPVHMVPALIVQVDALPLTPNGKLDRQALPLPGPAIERPYEAPHGEVEQALAAIWAQVLGVARVGRQDHFFELGGHSLAVLQVQTRVQAAFGVQLQLRTYFETPSLADVGAALREALAGSVQESEALDRMADLLDALEDD
ncbi:MAG: amino acid adenylation domain-containing protein, partial [Pseudacidovorax sp.]|nr:amino acid adenylation domain-containing protein [Pseudacidovorax sp.]